MRIDIETVNPVIDSEYRCKTQIEIDDMRQMSVAGVQKLAWEALVETYGRRANLKFKLPDVAATVKTLIAKCRVVEKQPRFDAQKHYSKKWMAYYKAGFGSPTEVYGADEQTAMREALALHRKNHTLVDERPMSVIVDRVEEIVDTPRSKR